MRKIIKILSSKIFYICLLIVLQILSAVMLVYCLESFSVYIGIFFRIISFCIIIYISNRSQNTMFMFSWSVLILTFPVMGWLFYLLFERNGAEKKLKRFRLDIDKCSFQKSGCWPDNISSVFQCIYNLSGANIYENTATEFFESGEKFYVTFINELKKAKKYIYLEYFIVSEGKVWNEIYGIMKEKSRQGVDIRFIYDDMCCSMFSKKFRNELEKEGIYTIPFNKLRPFPDVFINYRDHRKITVIDGNTAFTGGLNIADEYMNKKKRFGYWKDTALMIKGDAVSEFTEMFVKMWNQCSSFYLSNISGDNIIYNENGYVQPFGSFPDKVIGTARMAYIKLINQAVRYIYITTPYLVPDSEMMNALCLASRSGVDVKIITPYIPDKWYIQISTRSNYKQLLENGVHIYEYLPGFIHSKTIVTDDESAIIGTANFDFRSFYFLFENGVFMYKTKAVRQMKTDFENILKVSLKTDIAMCDEISVTKKMISSFLKLIAPLM